MAETGGPEAAASAAEAAAKAAEASLSARYAAAVDADRVLVQALADAHAATADAGAALAAIVAEVEARTAAGWDTALGAREFQRFLIAKQREVIAILTAAGREDAAGAAAVASARWATPAG